MRWDSIVLLLSDGRVRFLLGFVAVAVIVAIVLVFIEVSLNKKKVRIKKKKMDDAPIDGIQKFLKGDKTAKEKLDFVDRTAKEYFARVYGIPVGAGYSMLIAKFEKDRRTEELGFCKAMFVGYYSNKKLTNSRVKILSDLFIDIVNKKNGLDRVLKSFSVFEKIGRFFSKYRETAKQKSCERINLERVRKMERVVILRKKKKNRLDKIAVKKKKALLLAKVREEKILLKKRKKELIKKRKGEDREARLIAKRKVLDLKKEKKKKLKIARAKIFRDKSVRKENKIDLTFEEGVASRIVNKVKKLSY